MSLTAREPEPDVLALQERLRADQKGLSTPKQSHALRKDTVSEMEADHDQLNDDVSSMASGAHVRSVQHEPKA